MIPALCLLLAACVGAAPVTTSFRSTGAPIWSAAAFAPAQIAGRWRQVAAYQDGTATSCRDGAVEFRPTATGLAVEGRLCLNGVATRIKGLATASGPGRLSVKGQEDWWILWVDSGYRTLAIGTPSGRFGFVLDRGEASPDRIAAAREVFDFNGYSAAAFRPF
jgi:apolipoprotein D and lipocalin family protein